MAARWEDAWEECHDSSKITQVETLPDGWAQIK